MTKRANRWIEVLRENGGLPPGASPDLLTRAMRNAGLRPSEAGWVLHFIYGVSMPEAVHRAGEVPAGDTHVSIRAVSAPPIPEMLRDEMDSSGSVRLVGI